MFEQRAIAAGWYRNAQGNWEKHCDRPDPDFLRWFPHAEQVCDYLDSRLFRYLHGETK